MMAANMGTHSKSSLATPHVARAFAFLSLRSAATFLHLKSHKESGMTTSVVNSNTTAVTYSTTTLPVSHPGCRRPVSQMTMTAMASAKAPQRMVSSNVLVVFIFC